jgi:saccharopine dehydrogenase-like NADP-dependent oxidoreductase
MNTILILGAGRSSSDLITHLLQHSDEENYKVRIGDADVQLALRHIIHGQNGEAFTLNASNEEQLVSEISRSEVSLVISMLPAVMHPAVAQHCIRFRKSLITPSYVSDEMGSLHDAAMTAGVLLLNEMGVDPGIDHMSAMAIVHRLQAGGMQLVSFESYTGGLIAPESDDNPWGYKITWNPRNVVLAGAGVPACFVENHVVKYVPYQQLFRRLTEINIPGHGSFDGYVNRDSVKYRAFYGLPNIPTLIRGTLRKKGFCTAWDNLVQIGLTDDHTQVQFSAGETWADFTSRFLPGGNVKSQMTKQLMTPNTVMEKLEWLGIFSDEPIGFSVGTPAQVLQKLIEKKWRLGEHDKDMIVMWHRFVAIVEGMKKNLQSYLVVYGDDPVHTAMSKTVGFPIAIAARMYLRGEISLRGVQVPTLPEIYQPVLRELEKLGIRFTEEEDELG